MVYPDFQKVEALKKRARKLRGDECEWLQGLRAQRGPRDDTSSTLKEEEEEKDGQVAPPPLLEQEASSPLPPPLKEETAPSPSPTLGPVSPTPLSLEAEEVVVTNDSEGLSGEEASAAHRFQEAASAPEEGQWEEGMPSPIMARLNAVLAPQVRLIQSLDCVKRLMVQLAANLVDLRRGQEQVIELPRFIAGAQLLVAMGQVQPSWPPSP
ncbi:uncharacterized protein LOC115095631 [Rhinatrema bivittatum]|uniref:uncharacterized protein LOC115095631 n=1 Tax=Rhinatrema bivittatum TaxID=194408 RepID=UPI0011279A07|nr:uncharacterized protein LOC115095631 [Rhinatrema bivittatum]